VSDLTAVVVPVVDRAGKDGWAAGCSEHETGEWVSPEPRATKREAMQDAIAHESVHASFHSRREHMKRPVWVVVYDEDGTAIASAPIEQLEVDMGRYERPRMTVRTGWREGWKTPPGLPEPEEPTKPPTEDERRVRVAEMLAESQRAIGAA
jgi:hypothetical protein